MKFATSMPGIKARRKALGLGVAEAAAELGVTRQSWNNWESGRSLAGSYYLPAMAEILHCRIEDLYEEAAENG